MSAALALPLSFPVEDLPRRTDTTPKPRLRVCERYHLLGWAGDHFELVQPLPVDIERDQDGTFLVSDPLFAVYGHGPTEDEALHDFLVSLGEYHEIMADGANPETRAVVANLDTYLQRAPKVR